MEFDGGNHSWVTTDGKYFLYSILALVVTPILLLLGGIWYVALAIPGAIIDWLILTILGDGLIHGFYTVLMIFVIIVGFVAIFGAIVTMFIGTNPTPELPTGIRSGLWWLGLPAIVAAGLLYGFLSGFVIDSTTQFLVALPVFIFVTLLIATRILSVVRQSKSSEDVALTATTVLAGYVIVAGVLDSMALVAVVPAVLDPISGWPGLGAVYLPVLLLLFVILSPLERLGAVDVSGSGTLSAIDSSSIEELPAHSPLFFDAESGDGLFAALAIAFVLVPAASALIESSWHGLRNIQSIPKLGLRQRNSSTQRTNGSIQKQKATPSMSKEKAKREFKRARERYETTLKDIEAALENGRYDDADRLLNDVAPTQLNRCQNIEDDYKIPGSVPEGSQLEELRSRLDRHKVEGQIEESIQKQKDLVDEYRRHHSADEYDNARQALQEAKNLATTCMDRITKYEFSYSLPMEINEMNSALNDLETKRLEQRLEDIVAEYVTTLATFDDAIWSGDLERCERLFETLRQKRSRIEQLEQELGTNAKALSDADRDLDGRIHHVTQQAIRSKFNEDVETGDCDGAFAWPEAKARYLLASGTQAAENGNYRDAIALSEAVSDDLLEYLDAGSPDDRNRDALSNLLGTARDQKGKWERQLIVQQINDAVDREPDEYEEASKILTRALSRIDQTNAFDEEERAIIEQDTRKAYATVHSDGASALVDSGNERLEAGDESSAVTFYEKAMTVLEDLSDAVADWNDVTNEPINEQYDAVEQKYVEAQTTLLEERIRLGIDQFDAGEYDAALETFRDVTNETETVRERVENEYDRLLYLQDLTEANAKTTQRTSLGIGTGSKSLQEPEDDAAGTTQQDHIDSSASATSQAAGAPGNEIFDAVEASLPDEIDYMQLEKEAVLGSGGNATVHKARLDGDETKHIALKEPQVPEGTVDKALFDRFRDEAENWEEVDDHPHVVSILDHGMHTLPWIAMEYLDGGHLGDRVGKLGTEQALWTALGITRAIKHAHRPGITHLDIKPENILFKSVDGYWDIPKVADWGLANHLLDRPDDVEGLSPQYAAPEQFDPEIFGDTDLETDIYQLGVVFYELFTGTLPYEGDRYNVLQNDPDRKPTPPSELADVPPELDDVLLKALAPEKADRYENVAFLEQELELCFESLVNDASPPR